MDLMDAFNARLKEQEEEERVREEAEAKRIKDGTTLLINYIEKQLDEHKFSAEYYDHDKTPVICLTIRDFCKTFETLADEDIDSEVVERLEQDGYGPINAIELKYAGESSPGPLYRIEVTLWPVDYSKKPE